MENSLKQRIVGAVVLIALAVIFLPSILKEKENQQPFHSKIPAKPISLMNKEITEEEKRNNQLTIAQLDNLDQPKLSQHDNLGKSKLVDKVGQSKRKNIADNKVTTQLTQTNLVPVTTKLVDKTQNKQDEQLEVIGDNFKQAAWVIQIASFSNKTNAISFVDKLKTSGHKAYRRTSKNGSGKQLFRIYVGPYIKKHDAQESLIKIDKISGLSGIILTFDPTKH